MKKIAVSIGMVLLWVMLGLAGCAAIQAPSHLKRARAYCQKGKVDEAIAEYRKALRLDPDNAEAHLALGGILALEKQFDPAIVEFREVIRIDPERAITRFGLGLAYREKGLFDEAIAEFEGALGITHSPDMISKLQGLLEETRDEKAREESIRALRGAIELHPDDAKAHLRPGPRLGQ